jgi:hypothetical protein
VSMSTGWASRTISGAAIVVRELAISSRAPD